MPVDAPTPMYAYVENIDHEGIQNEGSMRILVGDVQNPWSDHMVIRRTKYPMISTPSTIQSSSLVTTNQTASKTTEISVRMNPMNFPARDIAAAWFVVFKKIPTATGYIAPGPIRMTPIPAAASAPSTQRADFEKARAQIREQAISFGKKVFAKYPEDLVAAEMSHLVMRTMFATAPTEAQVRSASYELWLNKHRDKARRTDAELSGHTCSEACAMAEQFTNVYRVPVHTDTATVIVHHVCSRLCTLTRTLPELHSSSMRKLPMFICQATGKLHLCESSECRRFYARAMEGEETCSLTGRVLSGRVGMDEWQPDNQYRNGRKRRGSDDEGDDYDGDDYGHSEDEYDPDDPNAPTNPADATFKIAPGGPRGGKRKKVSESSAAAARRDNRRPLTHNISHTTFTVIPEVRDRWRAVVEKMLDCETIKARNDVRHATLRAKIEEEAKKLRRRCKKTFTDATRAWDEIKERKGIALERARLRERDADAGDDDREDVRRRARTRTADDNSDVSEDEDDEDEIPPVVFYNYIEAATLIAYMRSEAEKIIDYQFPPGTEHVKDRNIEFCTLLIEDIFLALMGMKCFKKAIDTKDVDVMRLTVPEDFAEAAMYLMGRYGVHHTPVGSNVSEVMVPQIMFLQVALCDPLTFDKHRIVREHYTSTLNALRRMYKFAIETDGMTPAENTVALANISQIQTTNEPMKTLVPRLREEMGRHRAHNICKVHDLTPPRPASP